MASLRDIQRDFAAALRTRHDSPPSAVLGVRPARNLDIYRNNAEWQFRNSLALSFPVVRRRVGEEFFRQLTFNYRAQFPSRSGDLYWVGRDFASFLATHLAHSEYAWLEELARLEWGREQVAVAEGRPSLGVEVLATFAADELGELVFDLQPSLFLGESQFPVVSVWMANQAEDATPVDQSAGPENYLMLARDNGVEVVRLTRPLFEYLRALQAREPMAEAMNRASFDEAGLLAALRFMFGEGLVTGVDRPVPHSANR
jgi:hypothetical protein